MHSSWQPIVTVSLQYVIEGKAFSINKTNVDDTLTLSSLRTRLDDEDLTIDGINQY